MDNLDTNMLNKLYTETVVYLLVGQSKYISICEKEGDSYEEIDLKVDQIITFTEKLKMDLDKIEIDEEKTSEKEE